MILLADGGSTKVDWCLVDNGELKKQIFTKGANPFFRSREDICEELKIQLLPHLKGIIIESVYFFGAGCAFPEKNEVLHSAIAGCINVEKIEINSDLLAAAKGLCGKNRGIVCIMGTGSNSCCYDGEKITENIPPLGYILGDEGSGAVLGRLFIGACLKNQLTKGLKEKFLDEFQLTLPMILDKVYRQPFANRFLASLSPFIARNIHDATVYHIVYDSFKDFFIKNVMLYDYRHLPVYFTGSIAYHLQEVLINVAAGLNIEIKAIEISPMKGLISCYSTK
jgi:N-acetylglucosamine kinase-like BadF-type ATPase